MKLRLSVVVAAGVLFLAPLGAVRAAYDGVVSAKAVKYLDVLRKRPEPGYLYDRFYNTWLDEATVADLQESLVAQAAESKATADQLLLAFFYAKQGDDVAALEEFRKALTDNPASAETWFQKAAVEARTLDFETAIADLRKARELKPDAKLQVLVDKQLGRLLVRNRQVNDALKVWNELLAANPRDEELAEDLIELHIDEGLFEQAAKLAEGLLERTKDPYLSVTRRLRLGDIHQRGGNREKALEAYATALNDVGRDSWLELEILAQTEQVFRREDNLAQLRDHYTKLFETHPKAIALHRRFAKLLVELGEHDAAIAAYKQILELTPGDRANREEYVEVLAKIGKKDQAVEELNALCEQHPEDAELRFRLATLLHEATKADEAAAVIGKYLAASDKSEYAYLRAARALEKFERKPAAADVYRDMAAAFADSASAQEAYAGFLYANEKKDEALAIWRKLADGAELSDLLHVARALSVRDEHEAGLELLKARETDFAKEPLFYSQLAGTAIAMKKPELAVPWTRRRVELAETVTELEAALDQAVAACDRADQVEAVAKELEALPQRSLQQTCLFAELQEAAGNSEAADAALAKAAEGGNLLAISEQIRLFNQRRDWAAAAEATRKILELPGGRKSIHVRRLVELCQRDYQIEEALKWISEWKRLSPGSTSPWTTEAALVRLQGKEADAIAVLKSAVQKFEGDEDLRLRLAQLYAETDHLGDAERIYWQLYEDTEDAGGKLRWAQELAKLAEQQGKLTQLVESFEERRQSNRQSIVPLLALSEVHRVADNYEGRRQALTAAAKIKPDDLELLHQIARIEEQEGDWQAAIATLERGAKVDKTNRTRERIAGLHLRFGNADDGFAILFELAGSGAGDPRTLEAIADAMCGIQEWERAADFLAQRIADHPGDYRLRYLLGVAAEEADRMPEAQAQFLTLLDDQEELPDVAKKAQPTGGMNSYIDMVGKMAPPQVMEFMELSQQRYMAYQHRQQSGGMVLSSGHGTVGGPTANVQMPAKVDNVRSLALAHLATMGKLLDEEEEAELVRAMESHGVESAELVLKMNFEMGNMGDLPAMLEEDPDNEIALALVVFNQFGRPQPELAEWSAKAVEKFRKSYPELAVLAAVQAGVAAEAEAADATEPRPNARLDEALALAADVENPSPMTVMAVAVSLSGQPFNQQATQMQEAYRQKFSQLLLKWYPGLRAAPMYGQWAFIYVVGALAQGGDPSAYFAFLEDEVARWRGGTRGARNQNTAQMFGGGQQGLLLTPLTYPPQELADFPSSVLMLMQESNNNNPYSSSFAAQASGEGFEKEKVAPLIEKVRDPVLKLLLARKFEATELADKTLQALLAAEQPQLDAYLLAAGKAVSEEKHAEAVGLLAKARYLPMNREIRTKVDGAIVAAVTAAKAVDGKLAAEKQLLEAGRAACLRLRQSRLDANKRSELIAAMEDLGLKREAEKLDKLAATQAASPSAAAGVIYRSSPAASSASKDRVAQLVADGKRDAAVRLLTNDVLAQARQMLANPQNGSYMRYQFRELKSRVMALDMTKDVLAALESGESDNVRKVSEYAVVCEMFDMKKEARAAYERLLEKRPKDDALRVRLVLLLGTDETALAEEHFKKLGAASSQTVGQLLMEQMQDYQLSIEERLSRAELANKYLQTLADDETAQTGWSVSIVQALGNQMHTQGSGSNLPSLYSRNKPSTKEDERRLKLYERRRVTHQALCEQMLGSRDGARQGFTHLLAATEAGGAATDEFVARATKVLRDEAERRAPSMNQYAMYYSNSNDSSEVRQLSPEEFLVRRAAAADDWKLIDDELMPVLGKARNKDAGKQLERLVKLYRCPPEEFIGVAKEVMKQTPAAMHGQDNGADLSIVVAAWGDRKLQADLQPLVVERLKRLSKSQNHYAMPECVGDFVEATYRNGGGPKTLALLEEIATLYLGPKEKRADFLAKHNANQGGWSYGSPQGSIHVYGNFMSQLLQRDAVLPIVVLYLQDLPEMSVVQNVEHYARAGMTKLAKEPAEKLLADLAGSPWLADLDAFHPLDSGVGARENDTWLSWFLRSLNSDAKKREAFADLVAKQFKEKPTFGLGLIDACLRGEDAMLEYIAQRLEAIRQVEKERQTKIATFVAADPKVKERLKAKDLPASFAPVKDWLAGSKNLESQQLLDKIRKIKRIEELGVQSYEVGEYMATMVRDQIAADPEAVREVFFRFVELAADAQKRNQWNHYYGDGGSTAGHLLQSAFQGADEGSLARLPLLVDFVKNDKEVAIEYHDSNQFGVSNVLRRALDEALKVQKGKKARAVDAVQRLHDSLGEALADRSGSLFMDSYYDVLKQKLGNKRDLKLAADWARGTVARGVDHGVAGDFYAALCIVQKEQAAANKEKKAKASAENVAAIDEATEHYRNHFEYLIGNEELPIAWRLHLAAFFVRHDQEPVTASLGDAIVAAYTAALEKDVPITAPQQRSLLAWLVKSREQPGVKENLATWQEKWARRYLRPAASGARQYESLSQVNDQEVLLNVLRLYLARGDEERVNVLLRRYDEPLGSNPMVAILLMRAEKPELAARFLRAHWAEVELVWGGKEGAHYDDAIKAQEEAVCAKLVRDEERFFVRALLASLPSYERDAQAREARLKENAKRQAAGDEAPLWPRDARMMALANEFEQAPFKDETFRIRTLVVLSRSRPAGALLASAIAEQYKKLNLALAFQQDDERRWKIESELAARHFENEFSRGEAGAFVETFDKLAKSIDDNNSNSARRVEPLIACAFNSLRDEPLAWTPDECAAVGKSVRGLLVDKNYVYLNDFAQFNTVVFLTHGRSHRGAELEAWCNGLSNNCKQWVKNRGLNNQTWAMLKGSVDKPTAENLPERLKLVESAIACINGPEWFKFRRDGPHFVVGQNQDQVFTHLIKSGLVTRDEVLAYASQVDPRPERHCMVDVSLAEWLAAEKAYREAAPLFETGVAHSPESWTVRRYNWTLDAGTAWAQAGEVEKARALADEVKDVKLETLAKQKLQKLTQLIEKHEKEKVRPAA